LTCQYSLLQHEALLHIAGPDSLTFLQGQTTCDTRNLDPKHALPGIYCTPQGRVVCDFLLSQLGKDHYTLRMRRDIRASSSATFGKYIIFSKAELDDQRDDWQVVACWGADAAQTLREVFGAVPTARFGACGGDDFVLVQVDERGRQFECYLDSETSPQRLAQIDELMQQSVESEWQALEIAAGIARIEAATVEEFVPQMLNYDLTGHISFNKGCYTGQEVVARLHYRGKSKRRMYLADLPGTEPTAAGTPLFSTGTEQSVGNVVNSAITDGQVLGLVVATANGVENGLHLGAKDGPVLSIGELPYSLESD
jgi:folate-binding protein YgfZ